MFKLLCVLAILPLAVFAYPKSYPVVRCDNGAASPIAIRIDGCPGAICEVKRGSVVNYEIDFRTNSAGSAINIKMQVQIFGQTIEVPIPPAQANGCNNLIVGSCPYQNNQMLTHRGSVPVPADTPTGLVVTIIASYNGQSSTLACAKVQGYAA